MDWTPQQYYTVDKALDNRLRNSIITMDVDGEAIRVDNHIAKDRYPELSFLFDPFDDFYEGIADNEEAKSFLDRVEGTIKYLEAEASGDAQPAEIPEGFEVVREWFHGCPGFYYSYRNNEILMEWLNQSLGITEPDMDER